MSFARHLGHLLSFSEADCTEYQESAALLLTGTFHVQNGVKQCH